MPKTLVPLTLNSRAIMCGLWGTTVLLVGLSVGVNAIRIYAHHGNLLGWSRLLDVDYENNIPTFFSACLLLGCAIMLALISRVTKRSGGRMVAHWTWLALGFFFLGLDEIASIHESFSEPVEVLLGILSLPRSAWVVVGAPGVVAVAAIYLPFLWQLPARTRWIFCLAGAIYVGGAVGVEIPEGLHWTHHGRDLGYALYTGLEEGMEMAGATLFLGELFSYYASLEGIAGIVVRVRPAEDRV